MLFNGSNSLSRSNQNSISMNQGNALRTVSSTYLKSSNKGTLVISNVPTSIKDKIVISDESRRLLTSSSLPTSIKKSKTLEQSNQISSAQSPKEKDSVAISDKARLAATSASQTTSISGVQASAAGNIAVTVDGDSKGKIGYVKNGEYMVGLRDVFSELGADIDVSTHYVGDPKYKVWDYQDITVTSDDGATLSFRIRKNEVTTTGYYSKDGDPRNKRSINMTAEIRSDGSTYISDMAINHLYAVQITNKSSGINIESSIHVEVNNDEIGSTGRNYAVRNNKAYANIPDIIEGLGYKIVSQDSRTSLITAIKGPWKIEFDTKNEKMKIKDERNNIKEVNVSVKNINGRDMVEIEDLEAVSRTSIDWNRKTGEINIKTPMAKSWETKAGEFLFEVLEAGLDELVFDDIKTLFDKDASTVDRAFAAISILPVGKLIGAGKQVYDILKKHGGSEIIGFVDKVLSGSVKAGKYFVKFRIGEDSVLTKETEKAMKDDKIQKAADNLIHQYLQGNSNPGIENNYLFDGVFELRAKNGARVYLRTQGDTVEILAKSDKHNQQKVIDRLKVLYSKK